MSPPLPSASPSRPRAVVQPSWRKRTARRELALFGAWVLALAFVSWCFQVMTRDTIWAFVTDLLAGIRNGTFNVHLDHRHLDPVVNRLVLGIITAALFVSSSLLWSMKAPPMVGGVSVVGAAGYLAATYLGWRLYRAIKASGNVDSSD